MLYNRYLNFVQILMFYFKYQNYFKNKIKMSRHNSNKKEKKDEECSKPEYFESLKVRNLKVKQFCAVNAKIKQLKATKVEANTIETNTLILDGADVGCLIGRPPVVIASNEYDCMDCNGAPIRPSNINQDVWDVLTCNRNAQQQILQEEFLQGRNEIRCIKQAYGCPVECPPDCPPPSTCQPTFQGFIVGNTLTVTSIVPDTGALSVGSTIYTLNLDDSHIMPGTIITAFGTGTGGVGTYTINIAQDIPEITIQAQIPCPCLASTGQPGCSGVTGPTGCFGQVPANCIPDYDTCAFDIPNNLYRTLTLPFVFKTENVCGGVDNEGFSFADSRFISNMSYNLDITNVTCNLGTRVATVMVHFAYQEGPTGPLGPTGGIICPPAPCESCPGVTGQEGLSCILQDPSIAGCADLSPQVICGIVRVNCRQYYYTININLGENFSNVINIPTEIIQAMINASPRPFDPCDVRGAFQMAIFLEEGLEVSNNQGVRGGGTTTAPDGTTQLVGCFNAEAKISMANGEFKLAKDVVVGDEVLSTNGDSTIIIGKYVQEAGAKQLVKINDLIISQPHRIMYDEKWIKPIEYPNSQLIDSEIPVYNFITEDSRPFIVEGIIASSIGQFCQDSHDMSNPLHQLWGSHKIVELFQMHPQWPNIEMTNDDPFLRMIKDLDFATEYLAKDSPINKIEKAFDLSVY